MGLIHTRSERDMAQAQAVVWQGARCAMLEHLTEETRQIPEVVALMETFEDLGSKRWDDVRDLQHQMESEAKRAQQGMREISARRW
jgi:aminoglycoside N3'-acetyltransferase